MTAPRLDKSHPDCGTIHPAFKGAQFVLHGHYYSAQGQYLFSEGGVKAGAGAKEVAAEVAASVPPEAKPKSSAPSEVDLVAWYKGEAKYGFPFVKKAASAAMPGSDVSTAASIRAAMEDAGLVSEA